MAWTDRIPSKFLKLSAAGLIALALHEGIRTTAYRDTKGIPTIGVGETKGVKMGDKTTPERALSHLLIRLEKDFEPEARECLGDVPLYQYEYDAYVDFSYNVGSHGFCTSTTLKLLKEGKYTEACYAMGLWIKNKELKGRRQSEINMCLGKPNA